MTDVDPAALRSRRVTVVVTVVSVLVIVLSAVVIVGVVRDDTPDRPGVTAAADAVAVDHDYLIPAGTGARIDGGEVIDILPAELVMTVGETIRIVNNDDRGHTVGVFYVGPGEELRQTFTAPGELSGECSVHSSGQFVLRVVAA